MFTGIVRAKGRIGRIENRGADRRFTVNASLTELGEVAIGDSIAVNGCCLTVVTRTANGFTADVSTESLTRTTLDDLTTGDAVNLEAALTLGTPLGGHLVSGHVDGVGTVVERRAEGRSERWRFRVPGQLARYIAEKGSICVDGISLTVNTVVGADFEVNIVPHTADVTTLGHHRVGGRVNIEVDLVARYLERLISADAADNGAGVSAALLARAGFTG